MTKNSGPPAWRIHYAIGSHGLVQAFVTPDLIPGDPPTLRPDHALAQIGVTWDFGPLHEWPRPPGAGAEEPQLRSGPVTTEEVHAAVAKWERSKPPTIGQGLYDAFNDFLANRCISTGPAEFTDRQINEAVVALCATAGDWHEKVRAAFKAAGARPS